jgi:hypothetical protein
VGKTTGRGKLSKSKKIYPLKKGHLCLSPEKRFPREA